MPVPECPWHPEGKCGLRPHGFYDRKTPAGARVRRFLCPPKKRTISMLPICLAARLPGTTAEVERVAATAERPDFRPRDCPQLHPGSNISERGAQRWVQRRVAAVHASLAVLVTLLPQLAGNAEPTVAAMRAALGVPAALVELRALAETELAAVPAPIGFRPRFAAKQIAEKQNKRNCPGRHPEVGR